MAAMQHQSLAGRAAPARRSTPHNALASVLFLSAACSGGDSADLNPGGMTVDDGNRIFFEDPHFGGLATDVRLESMGFGRMVEVLGLNGASGTVAMLSEVVIGQSLTSDADRYELRTGTASGIDQLVILRDVTSDEGRAEFTELLAGAMDTLDPVQQRALGASGIYTMVPRNAALVLRFSDLLDPATIDPQSIQLSTGTPPISPFEPRVLASTTHGGRTASGAFLPTRIVIDLTVSEAEAFAAPSNPPVNGLGLPASFDVSQANVELRLPTETRPILGLTRVLENASGHPLATDNNGPVDASAPGKPLSRAFRSGGSQSVVADPFSGFLADETPPTVIGSLAMELTENPVPAGTDDGTEFILPGMRFQDGPCAISPDPGDVVVQPGLVAEITAGAIIGPDGVAVGARARLLSYPSNWSGPSEWSSFGLGAATLDAAYDPVVDAGRPECFVNVVPRATGFPTRPLEGIRPDARITMRFSEPMDPSALTAFDSIILTRSPLPSFGNPPSSDFVVGRLAPGSNLRDVTFIPDSALAHEAGESEEYFLTLAAEGAFAPPRDLAGNIVSGLPSVRLTMDPDSATRRTGGRVSRFSEFDEEPPFDDSPEWSGQILFDATAERIRPRPVVRSQVVIDENQPLVGQMTPFPGGVVTPFSPEGSRLQAIWRYADCGFSLTDPQAINIDVEGLSWSPASGTVTPETFSRFEIRLGHSAFAPDEIPSPMSLFPLYNTSGLRRNFQQNLLNGGDGVVVHPRTLGYSIDTADLQISPSGTTLMPFPLNRDVAPEDRRYFTWRDTDVRERGGPLNGGVEPQAYLTALNIVPPVLPYYRAGEAQTIGLPLLMEFRTYPDPGAIGQNGWDLRLASNSSSQPFFRSFSTGGTNLSGTRVLVDPDAENRANGGYNPGSTPSGATTPARDNSVHFGAIDYVTRISRAHSIWFESVISSEPSFTSRQYNPATIEPALSDQPAGTDVQVAYRGARRITYLAGANYLTNNDQDADGLVDFTENAFTLDLYGDFYNEIAGPLNHDSAAMNPGLELIDSDDNWRDTVSEIEGARFYQVRLSFIGNEISGQTPTVSALAVTWTAE